MQTVSAVQRSSSIFFSYAFDPPRNLGQNTLTDSGTPSRLPSLSFLSRHSPYVSLAAISRIDAHNLEAFKEMDQEVIDFYGRSGTTPIAGVPKFDSRRMVDGQRSIRFLKPLPPTSQGKTFELRTKVLGVYDKGKAGSMVDTETVLAERGGDVYSRALGSAFYVGQGNWGGPKGTRCRCDMGREFRS